MTNSLFRSLNDKYVKGHEKKYVFAIFSLGWIFLLLQHLCLGIYYDDYGNAALAYAYNVEGVNGTNYGIADILEWAKWIYNNWGGRLLYACAILIPALKEGIKLYMIMQSMVIILILYVMYRVVCFYMNKQSSIGVAISMLIAYGLIDINLHVAGTYWASASVLYIWPLLPMFITIFEYDRTCKRYLVEDSVNLKRFYIIQFIGIPLITLSQEQYGVALIVYYGMYIVLHNIKNWKKYWKIDCFCVGWSILTYLIMFCAPGNFVRLDTNGDFASLSILEKIETNLPIILDMYLKNSIQIFNLATVLATFIMVFDMLRKDKKKIDNIIFFITTVTIGTLMAATVKISGHNDMERIICLIFLVHTAILSLWYFGKCKMEEVTAWVFMAAASDFCLIMSPSIMHRSFLCYIFCVIVIINIVIWKFVDNLNSNKKMDIAIRVIGCCTFLVLANRAFQNSKALLCGYYENSYALEYNHDKLKDKDITAENKIVLLKCKNKTYRPQMAYDKGFEYIEYWMKEYYDLSQDVNFVWVTEEELENYNE